MKKFALLAAVGLIAIAWLGWRTYPGPVATREISSTTLASYPADSLTSDVVEKKLASVESAAAKPTESKAAPAQRDPIEAFQKESQREWTIARDPFTSRLRTLSGGVYSKPGETPEAFLKSKSLDLFGVAPEKLKPMKTVDTDQTKIVFQQFENGRPVFGQSLALVYEGDKLVRIQNDLQAITNESPAASVADTMAEAFEIYSRTLAEGSAPRLLRGEDLLFPYGQGQAVPAFRFYTAEIENGAEGRFEVLFDAENLRVIRKRSSKIE